MNTITREELKMALTQYLQDYQDDHESFEEYSNPSEDAEAVTNRIFEIIQSNHE